MRRPCTRGVPPGQLHVALVVRASSLHTLGQAGRLHHNWVSVRAAGPVRGHMRLTWVCRTWRCRIAPPGNRRCGISRQILAVFSPVRLLHRKGQTHDLRFPPGLAELLALPGRRHDLLLRVGPGRCPGQAPGRRGRRWEPRSAGRPPPRSRASRRSSGAVLASRRAIESAEFKIDEKTDGPNPRPDVQSHVWVAPGGLAPGERGHAPWTPPQHQVLIYGTDDGVQLLRRPRSVHESRPRTWRRTVTTWPVEEARRGGATT